MEDRPIVFTISDCSTQYDCCIRTRDARATADAINYCFKAAVVKAMTTLSEKYNNQGYAVLFEVD